MDAVAGDLGELGKPGLDVLAARVVVLALLDWVELPRRAGVVADAGDCVVVVSSTP